MVQVYRFRNPAFLHSNKNNFSSSCFPAGGILSQNLGALGLEANADAKLFSVLFNPFMYRRKLALQMIIVL